LPSRKINDRLRPGAFARLHGDVPFVTGLSDHFLEHRYGRNWLAVV
jgi:hypothetical protein